MTSPVPLAFILPVRLWSFSCPAFLCQQARLVAEEMEEAAANAAPPRLFMFEGQHTSPQPSLFLFPRFVLSLPCFSSFLEVKAPSPSSPVRSIIADKQFGGIATRGPRVCGIAVEKVCSR
eukprot:345363-Rhodomonas_salina.1